MYKSFKKGVISGLLALLVIVGIFIALPVHADTNFWKLISGTLQPLISSYNLRFDADLQPSGVSCAIGQTIEKTATNHWACVSGSALNSIVGTIANREGTGTFFHVSSQSFNAGGFNITNIASQSIIALDYVNGPASRSIDQTITGKWAFNASPLGFTVANSASVSGNFEAVGYASASSYKVSSKGTVGGAAYCLSDNLTTAGVCTMGIYTAANATLGLTNGTSGLSWNGGGFYPNTTAARTLGLQANQWLNFFTNNASISSNFETYGYASVSGNLLLGTGKILPGANSTSAITFNNAAGAAIATVNTTSNRFGILSGGLVDTTLEVGGGASISGNVSIGANAAPLSQLVVGASPGKTGKLVTVADVATPHTAAGANGILVNISAGGGIYMSQGNSSGVEGKYEAFGGVLGIGTMSNNNVVFVSNNTNRLALDTVGRFGVGTQSPESILDIASASAQIIVRSSGATASSSLAFVAQGGASGSNQGLWTLTAGGLSGVDYDKFQISNNSVPLFEIASNSHITLRYSSSPTVACTAGSPTVSANSVDGLGEFTAGVAATACTVTFAKPWAIAPHCFASVDGVTGLAFGIQTTTTTAVFNNASIGGVAVAYSCQAGRN